MIRIENASKVISKSGEKIEVYRDISLEVRENDFFVILGPMGCGKSSIVKLVSGNEKPTSGSSTINGKKTERNSSIFISSKDFFGLNPFKTIRKNVISSIKSLFGENREKSDLMEKYFRLFGMKEHENEIAGRLSGDIQLAVSLIRAFLSDSALILLDEPFAFLDSSSSIKVRYYLSVLWKDLGKAVVLTTHDAEAALSLGSRIAVLSHSPGRVKAIVDVPPEIARSNSDATFSALKERVYSEYAPGAKEKSQKLNCWEYKKCGREPGGAKAHELGICPAALDGGLDGVHGGKNSGRACWVVAGTYCRGEVQGSFAQKQRNCEKCDFYNLVKAEESPEFTNVESLLSYMRVNEDGEKRKYRTILENMIDPHIVSEALNDLEQLKKGGEKNITAFFSDIASFSVISEKLSSFELADLLNEYLSSMIDILKREKGTLDKYVGDALIGIFGAPIDLPENALHAAKTALQMKEKLGVLREKWRKEKLYCEEAWDLSFRIGINSGIAKVGFMGTSKLASYTMMGSTVNLANFLESACKTYGVTILVSESTKKLIDHVMFLRMVDSVVVKGGGEPVNIYELIGKKEDVPKNIMDSARTYELAYHFYTMKNWRMAVQYFKKSIILKGEEDRAANLLIERCLLYDRELDENEKFKSSSQENSQKVNCWEFKKCGREPGGAKVKELGVCPASIENRLDGVHHGKNSGRACWVVAGTFCKGEVQGSFAQKFQNCKNCDFYAQVRREESPRFKITSQLLDILKNDF